MSQNDGREAPIFIETFQQQRRHWYTATEGDAVHRFPVQPDEIWNSYAQIQTFDSGAIQNLVSDGDTDPGGIVTLRKNKALFQVPGTTHKFQTQAPDVPIAHVITATKGQVSPVAGNVGPVTTATAAPSNITGYTPVIVDANGTIHPMQASTWVVDGINAIVEFPYGVPPTMVAPFTITFYEYVGATGGGSAVPGAAAWHYVADATAPNQTLCPDPAFPSAVTSHFLAPVTQQSTESSGTMIMLDQSKGAFRAGAAFGAQWTDANRGDQSAAMGADTIASGAQSFAAGATNTASGIQSFAMGLNNTASGARSVVSGGVANTASGDDSTVPGGVGNSATGDASWAGGSQSTAGFANSFVWSDATGRFASAANEVTFGADGGFRVFGNGASSPAYTAGDIYLDAANTVVTGKLTVTGLIDPTGLQCVEQATNPGVVAAGNGTFWVRNDAPNVPMFTDDAGTDHVLAYASGGGSGGAFVNVAGVTLSDVTAPNYAITNDFVFGAQQLDNAGVTNEFARFLFDKPAGAFRAGVAQSSQWDAVNRGASSTAFGLNGTASGLSTVVSGGEENTASGDLSAIAGGIGNTASGKLSFIAGGTLNTASAVNTFAAGSNSTASHTSAFVWSDSTPRSSTATSEVTFGAAGGFRVLGNGASLPAYNAGDIYFDAANTVVTGKLTVTGLIDPTGLQCVEQAANPGTVAAGNGTFWVRNDAPNVPMFTDDAGTDYDLLVAAGSAVTLSDASILGTSLPLVNTLGNGAVGPALSVVGLNAGTGVTLTPTGTTDITIATNTTVTNAGVAVGFETLIATGSANPSFLTKGLVSGGGISLSSNGTDITITNSDPGSAVTLASAGGTTLVTDGTGPALEIKGLSAGTGIAVTVNASDLEIVNTDPGSAVALTSAGGTTLITDGTGPALEIKGLSAGTGIDVTVNAGDLEIATNTTVANAGVAAGFETLIATGSANPSFLTKGLVAGSGIVLSSNGTDITITNSEPSSAVTLTSAGGTTLVTDGTGPALEIKGLSAGAGIDVNVNANDLEIATNTTVANAGVAVGTETLIATGSANPSFLTKGLVAGSGIALSSNGTDITIDVAGGGAFENSAGGVTRLNTVTPNYAVTNDFVFGSQQLDDSGVAADDARFIFDKSQAFFAAGRATGAQWDTRGADSVAFGLDSTAAFANSFVWSDSTARSASAANEVTFGAAGGFRVFGNGASSPAYTAGDIYFDAANTVVTGKLTVTGIIDPTGLQCVEQSDNPGALADGNGTFWVRNDTPNIPMFTDDEETDHILISPFENSLGVTRANGASPGYAITNDFVFGSPQLNDTGSAANDARFLFDKSNGSFRAGTATGAQWDAASRGGNSAVFGLDNTGSGANSAVLGGTSNTSTGANTVVVGGTGNSNAHDLSCIAAGLNCALSLASGAPDNAQNLASGSASTITGGENNVVTGSSNTALATGCTITASNNGTISGQNPFNDAPTTTFSAIIAASGGSIASGAVCLLSGSNHSMTNGNSNAIIGGITNTLNTSSGAAIIGGENNTIQGGIRATVLGGTSNDITAAGSNSSIVGGNDHTMAGAGSVIVGGGSNNVTAAGVSSTIVGSSGCTMAGSSSAIVASTGSTITSGNFSAIVGGNNCTMTNSSNSLLSGVACSTTALVRSVVLGFFATSAFNDTFVWADAGDASTTAAPAANTFSVRATGGTTFWTNAGRTLGVNLPAGGGAWAAVSDRNMKENFVELDGDEVLSSVEKLPIFQYNFKGQQKDQLYRGPMAQDWHALFPSAKDDLRIDTIDLDGITLAAVKGLSDRSKGHATRLDALEAENASLRESIAALQARLAALEAK